jgi:transcriptional regulator with XRE-family HTH domain
MFGEYVRAKRETLGLSLREFCERYDFDIGNTSKMERGALPPPESLDLVTRYGLALGLEEGSAAMTEFTDLAAATRGKIPPDIMQRQELLKTLPKFFKTLRARKESFEEDVKDRFLSYLTRERGTAWLTTDANVVVEDETKHDFDYELTPLDNNSRRIALEIFRLVDDEDEIATTRFHGQIWKVLKNELDDRGVKDFSIQTPARFTLPKARIGEYCKRIASIIESIVKQNPSIEEFEVESFKGTKYDGLNTVVFVSHGGPGFVNPGLSAEDAFALKLRDKERQLPHGEYERVLLAVNWIMFVGATDAISALATMNLDFMEKTDRVYIEASPGNFALVYDRSVRMALDHGDDPPTDKNLAGLYHSWLENRLGKDPRAFRVIRDISARMGNVNWIPNGYMRERIVWEAVELVKQGQIEDGLWVARQFKQDPDPQLCNRPDDPEGKSNLHEIVKRGGKTGISSVRGSACWLLQRLVQPDKPELFPQILAMVEELARDENLYVRQESTVPLAELARRRMLKSKNGSYLMDEESRRRTRNLAFEMLHVNAEYHAILERLGAVLEQLTDLNELEARDVLNGLSTRLESGVRSVFSRLLIYFAIYRQEQFTESGAFDSREFKSWLIEAIREGPEILRTSLAWQLYQMGDFEKLKEFILQIPEAPYAKRPFFYFFTIINSLPLDLRGELNILTKKAIQKEKDADPACPAYSEAELLIGLGQGG